MIPQTLSHRTQDGDPPAHTGLERDVHTRSTSGTEDLLAVHRQKSLVGGHDGLSARERPKAEATGHVVPADQLDDDLDGRIIYQALGIGVEVDPFERDTTIGRGVEVGDTYET
jgi:hypothetical protein